MAKNKATEKSTEKAKKTDKKETKEKGVLIVKGKRQTVKPEAVLAVMQKLTVNGIKEFQSRVLSDKMELEPDYGRGRIRNIMRQLARDGNVKIERKMVKDRGARAVYVYSLTAKGMKALTASTAEATAK